LVTKKLKNPPLHSLFSEAPIQIPPLITPQLLLSKALFAIRYCLLEMSGAAHHIKPRPCTWPGGPAPILPRYRSDKELSDMRAGSIHPSEGKRTPGSIRCPENSASVQRALLSFDKPPGRHLRSVRTTRMRGGYGAWKSFLCSFLR